MATFNKDFIVKNGLIVQSSNSSTITTSAASSIGLIIKGFTSQSSSLQEWQNVGGTVLSKVDASGNITAASFVKTSGTSAQFLKADGTVDSSTYLTTGTASSTYAPLASPSLTGTPLSTTAAVDTNTTQIATTAFVVGQASGANPLALGSVAQGTSLRYSRQDHVHPTTGIALLAGATFTGQIQSTLANSTTTGGGQIYLNGATGNRIDFNTNGTSAPAFTTRSVGTKIVLYPLIGGSTVDYALGIEGSHMWSSVEQATSAYGFKWYGGTTNVMTLRGNGTISLNSTSATLGDGSVAHQLGVVSGAATNIGLVVRAATSQSGDLQQWQSSAGTKLSYLDSAGKIFANGLRLDGSDGSNNNVYKTGTLGLLSGLGTQLYLNQDNNATGGSLIIRAVNAQTSNLTEWRNVAGSTVLASMSTIGAFSAVTKSFDIEHPTKENMRLRYGSLEGPENGVYVRGNTKNNIIELPDYWTGLVDESTITVSITSIGKFQKVYLEKIEDNKIYIGGRVKEISYIIFGERKDVDKLLVEY